MEQYLNKNWLRNTVCGTIRSNKFKWKAISTSRISSKAETQCTQQLNKQVSSDNQLYSINDPQQSIAALLDKSETMMESPTWWGK